MIKKIFIPIISILALISIDQITKFIAKTNLVGSPKVLIDGVLELRYVENSGAAFGILGGAMWLFYLITFIVLAAIIFIYIKVLSRKGFLPLRILSVFIFAGAVGNFIDRIRLGYVVDFVYISLINFPVFNIADIFVSWSAVLVLILLIFKYKDSDFKLKKEDDK